MEAAILDCNLKTTTFHEHNNPSNKFWPYDKNVFQFFQTHLVKKYKINCYLYYCIFSLVIVYYVSRLYHMNVTSQNGRITILLSKPTFTFMKFSLKYMHCLMSLELSDSVSIYVPDEW